jgi:hypothetical protein
MTSTVKVQKHQDHVAIKVKFKNPQTGDIIREDIITDTIERSFVIFDTQSLEIEEIPSINK